MRCSVLVSPINDNNILTAHIYTYTVAYTMYRVFLIPKYIPGAAPIASSEQGDPLPDPFAKLNEFLSKLIESEISAGLNRFKTKLSKEIMETFGTLTSRNSKKRSKNSNTGYRRNRRKFRKSRKAKYMRMLCNKIKLCG